MLKAKESVSKESYAKIRAAVDSQNNGESYEVVYGYAEKNLLIINLISHYAIGFKNDEICVVEISKDGSIGEAHKFTSHDDCKFNLYGKVCLTNDSKKLKITVPAVVPTMPGTRQLSINQVEVSGKFNNLVKGFKG